MSEDLVRLYRELNQPSIAKFKQALKKRNVPFTEQDLLFTKADTTRQVQAPPLKRNGKIASAHLWAELQADLLDYTAQPFQKYKYVLIVQDVFSRIIWVEACFSKKPKEILEKFEIIHQKKTKNDEKTEFIASRQTAGMNSTMWPKSTI